MMSSLNLDCKRNSKDKIVDNEWKKLLDLFDTFNGVVLNGRINGDGNGE